MNMKQLQICSLVLLSWLVFFPLFVVGECTCDAQEQEEGTDVKKALITLKIVSIFSILGASAIGVVLPTYCKRFSVLAPESDYFFWMKAFAAGIILSTAFIHILPDAFENLTSPCLNASPWGDFPFTGFIAMVAATLTMMVDTAATAYYRRRSQVASALPINNKPDDEQPSDSGGHIHMHGHGHSHSHTLVSEEDSDSDSAGTLVRHRVISHVLEFGIVVHSVIIGITVGVSHSPSTIKPLIAALVLHQLCEGMGLGGCLVQARFKLCKFFTMVLFFSLTTPIGIVLGIGISKLYKESSPVALILQGVSNAAASGILIYMSLVDLLAADFMSQKLKLMSSWKLIGYYASLFLGMGCMSVLAIWA